MEKNSLSFFTHSKKKKKETLLESQKNLSEFNNSWMSANVISFQVDVMDTDQSIVTIHNGGD